MHCVEEKSDIVNEAQQYDYVVVGLGKTGVSCVRYLAGQGHRLAVIDSRDIPPGMSIMKTDFPDVILRTGKLNHDILMNADYIIVSPGVSLSEPAIVAAVDAGIPVTGDIELFCQQAKAPIIAITGSNGKSTVTTLLDEMARQQRLSVLSGGNLGTPALDLLEQPIPDFYVLELSSFQLERTYSLNAYASTVLNISADHMDRYSELAQYAKAKQIIYRGDGMHVFNADDPVVMVMLENSNTALSFSVIPDSYTEFGLVSINDELWLSCNGEPVLKQQELLLKGKHNIANALAAMALASCMDISIKTMSRVLRTFRGLPHRFQFVEQVNGVDWINDSKATNIGACIASIEGLNRKRKLILIAGGDSKDVDVSELAPVFKTHLKKLYLLGLDAKRIADAVHDCVPYQIVASMEQAVEEAAKVATPGDTVLLAPACASLDMFENYEERGQCFTDAVSKLESR